MPNYPAEIGPFRCGSDQPLLWIAGPCVLEGQSAALEIAEELQRVAQLLSVQLVFKASFDKANRTSSGAYRGPGLIDGLKILAEVRRETGLPVTTDIHESAQAAAVGEVCDLLQIPAFLARQTDLLVNSAQTGKAVNVKKAQFLAPVRHAARCAKARRRRLQQRVALRTRHFLRLRPFGERHARDSPAAGARSVPVVFDATHSVQEPGGLGGDDRGQSCDGRTVGSCGGWRWARTACSSRHIPIRPLPPATGRT